MRARRVLRIYLPADWPGKSRSCPWALLSDRGDVTARGRGEPPSWPDAGVCEAIIPAGQISWLTLRLPERLGRDAERIAAYALEDKLLEPPEAVRFQIRDIPGGSEKSATVVRRARVQEISDVLETAGRRLDRLYCEMQLLVVADGDWVVCRFDDSAFLKPGMAPGLAIDWPTGAPPEALQLAVAGARARDQLPQRIVVRCPPGQIPSLENWTSVLGLPSVAGPPFDPLVADADAAADLLGDAFLTRDSSRRALRRFQQAGTLLVAIAAAHTALAFGEWAWLAHQARALRQEAIAIYRESLPGARAPVLKPSLQLHREASSTLLLHGQAGAGDLLPMLGAIGAELPEGVAIRRIQFEMLSLQVVVTLSPPVLRRVLAALHQRGYGAEAETLRTESAGTEYRVRMRVR